jgi:hypothetical protein
MFGEILYFFSTWTFCKNISPCRETPKNVLKKNTQEKNVVGGVGG